MSGVKSRIFQLWFSSLVDSSLGFSLETMTHSILFYLFIYFGFWKPMVPRFPVLFSIIVHLMLYWNCLFTKTVLYTFVSSTACRMPGALFGPEWISTFINKWTNGMWWVTFFAPIFDPSQYPHTLFHVFCNSSHWRGGVYFPVLLWLWVYICGFLWAYNEAEVIVEQF